MTVACRWGAVTMNLLGELVKKRRDELGLKQDDLDDLGIPQSTVTRIEGASRRFPRDATLKRIAEQLKIPFKDLVLARSGIDPAKEADYVLLIGYAIDGSDDMKGGQVPAPKVILGGRSSDDCFELYMTDDRYLTYGFREGTYLILECIGPDRQPAIGDLVALETETGWEVIAYLGGDARLAGRIIGFWGTID